MKNRSFDAAVWLKIKNDMFAIGAPLKIADVIIFFEQLFRHRQYSAWIFICRFNAIFFFIITGKHTRLCETVIIEPYRPKAVLFEAFVFHIKSAITFGS